MSTINQFLSSLDPNIEQGLIFLIQILLATFLGLILGTQRKMVEKAAGPRTYALVSFSSCLLALIGYDLFPNNIGVIAAIVTGIGFLGAGTILHRDDRVQGLTTAAGLWVSATIGIAVGTGFFFFSLVATIISLLILSTDDRGFRSFNLRNILGSNNNEKEKKDN
ncbi:MAG: MgtC/SapB family protein [Planctomycetes bacterium]|jgi:putative Mg2+ transporter-C (MgtC) family protein|nr:MgtC/SapB family protein [Planctomycetota bacterium]